MKKILFTGARSGIVKEVIDKLVNKKYYIYLTVHTEKQLEIVKRKYAKYSNVECFKLDITNKEDRNKLRNLDIDILFNNAAIGEGGSMAEIPMDKVRDNFEVNVFSTFEIIQIVLEKMLQKDKGKIINMASLAGIIPINFLGSYCASKASIIKMTTCLKNELNILNSNVKICLIEPGLYHTGFNQVMLNNKYEWMDIDSYFKYHLDYIKKKENFLFNTFEKYKFNSITKKIIKAIKCKNPKFIYKAPCMQAIGAKLYTLLLE